MITRIVRLTIQPEKVEDFTRNFWNTYPKIRHFDGCSHLELYEDDDQPNIMITFSKWDSAEHLEKYRNSALFKNTWAIVKPMFAEVASAFSMKEIKA